MCLHAIKVFDKPVKVMTGWKHLYKRDNGRDYSTPHRGTLVKGSRKYLKANGPQDIKNEITLGGTTEVTFHGGFIHCYRTRRRARMASSRYHSRIVKVKCYNVHAIGRGDIVCDKIEFLWDVKT